MSAYAIPNEAPACRVLDAAIAGALAGFGGRATHREPRQWKIAATGARRTPVYVALAGDWLSVERALPRAALGSIEALRRRGLRALDPGLALPPGVRPLVGEDDSRLRIRGERALAASDEQDAAPIVRWLEAAVRACATFRCRAPARAGRDAKRSPAESSTDAARTDVAALCEAAGWSASERDGGQETAIELPARGGNGAVALARSDAGGVRLRTVIAHGDDGAADSACEAAAVLALLRVAGSVRLVRALAQRTGDGLSAALEVRVEPPVDESALVHALSALALARDQVAAELVVLSGDPWLAHAYLRVQRVR